LRTGEIGVGGKKSRESSADQVLQFAGLVFPFFGFGQWILALGDAFPTGQFCQFGVYFGHMLLVSRHIFFGINGIDRAFGNADSAVDALVRVNGQKVGSFPEAIDGTYVDAVGVLTFDAGFGDGMCHFEFIDEWVKSADFN
jgi:hypothetical protein